MDDPFLKSMLAIAVYVLLVAIPAARILNRMGLSRRWVILIFIPVVDLVFLWALAYMRWPAVDGQQTRKAA